MIGKCSKKGNKSLPPEGNEVFHMPEEEHVNYRP